MKRIVSMLMMAWVLTASAQSRVNPPAIQQQPELIGWNFPRTDIAVLVHGKVYPYDCLTSLMSNLEYRSINLIDDSTQLAKKVPHTTYKAIIEIKGRKRVLRKQLRKFECKSNQDQNLGT